MFHYKDKLKDLKVELKDDIYTIWYKDEMTWILIENDIPALWDIELVYKEDAVGLAFENSHHIVVGEGNLKRDVWHFSKPGGPLPILRCGFTIHGGENTWSSTPHPFEMNLQDGFEEVFLYLLSGGEWRNQAIQVGHGCWENRDSVTKIWQVKDRDISAIPMGYHPVVGEPGVHVSYIWAYLAKKKEWEKI